MANKNNTVKFNLGQTVITSNALDKLNQFTVADAILRHACGDWGDVCDEDRQSNEDALKHGNRLLSVYKDKDEVFWIITEWDRSVTTVLLPEDY